MGLVDGVGAGVEGTTFGRGGREALESIQRREHIVDEGLPGRLS